MNPFPKLFEPGKIGKLQLKNRIIMPPMLTRYVNDDGTVSERLVNYYAERAKGGCAMVTVEATYPRGGVYPGRIFIGSDRFIPEVAKLANAIHRGGAKAGIQLNPHRGRSDEVDPASASESIHPATGLRIRALKIEEIKKVINEFGEGARRSQQAGFDCITIHGGSGYLVSEFFSPRTNSRTDEYGGSVEKRAHFALDLLKVAKQVLGVDYPVIFRMTADEKVEGGYGLKEALIIARLLEEAGADAIDVISGVAETYEYVLPNMYIPRGFNVPLSQAIKKVVKIPVCVAGNINDPRLAEEILRDGKADFIDFGRPLIADPHLPNKAKAGKMDEIRKCMLCTRCIETILKPPVGPMVCSVNPAAGREEEFAIALQPAGKRKKVLIIGGGPAGMEAAVIASARGHDVTIWEELERLGGQLHLAAIPPGKDEVKTLIDHLTFRINQLNITVKTGKRVTTDKISKFSPDVVIVASGSKPLIPKIKGMEKKEVLINRDVLLGNVEVGKSVIVIGGGFIGCETADFLAEKGKAVTLIEILPKLASDLFVPHANQMVRRLHEKGVKCLTGVQEEEITTTGMNITVDGKKITLIAEDVVIAVGSVADNSLYESLQGKGFTLYRVGDCVRAARIREAISQGAEVGLKC